MVTMDQIKRGIAQYIDAEIAPKLTGVKRYGVQVYATLALQSDGIRDLLRSPAITMLGLVDENQNVDIGRLHQVALQQMKSEGKLDVDLPVVGRFTFDTGDVDKIYSFICGA